MQTAMESAEAMAAAGAGPPEGCAGEQCAVPRSPADPAAAPQAPAEDAAAEQLPAGGSASEQGPTEDAVVQEPVTEDPAVEQGPAEDAAVQQGPAEDPAVHQDPTEDPAVEQGPAEDPAVHQDPTEDPAVEQGPAEDPAVEQGPAEDPAVQQGPAENPAVEEPAVEQGGAEAAGGGGTSPRAGSVDESTKVYASGAGLPVGGPLEAAPLQAALDVGMDEAELSRLMCDDPTKLPQESEEGWHEYKRQLVQPSEERFQQLVTQLNYRLAEGQGEALYELGVEDDGTVRGLGPEEVEASVGTLERMAAEVGALCTRVADRCGPRGVALTMLVRLLPKEADHVEIRVATVGNVDSGKSTLIGVLTKGMLDNGRGAARANVFRHKHELESGRTSSISQQVLGFAADGEVTNYGHEGADLHSRTWTDIVTRSSKVLAFFDLAGHERYFKTTLFGLTGHLPDYTMLAIDSNRGGVVGMTREHLGISLALKVPVFVVVTKVDICSKHVLDQTMDVLLKLLKRPGVKKMPVLVRSQDDVLSCVKAIHSSAIVPIFQVSCVEGTSLELLRSFLNHLPASSDWQRLQQEPSRLHIDDSFTVQGVGTVVTGTLVSGTLQGGRQMLLGPNAAGGWTEVGVKSVRNKRVAVSSSQAGQTIAVALRSKNAKEGVKRKDIRKGMVLVDRALEPRATFFFEAEVLILVHPTTMKVGYTPILHSLTVRQAARIHHIQGEAAVLRTGSRALVTFHFMYRPEFVVPGASLVFREGRTKGIGTIVRVLPDLKLPPLWEKQRRVRAATT